MERTICMSLCVEEGGNRERIMGRRGVMGGRIKTPLSCMVLRREARVRHVIRERKRKKEMKRAGKQGKPNPTDSTLGLSPPSVSIDKSSHFD